VIPSFLALGDSYTIGEGVAESERWPAQLVTRLRASGTPVADPRIVAQTGWTTGDLQAAIHREQVAGQFDLVSLMAGVNDQYRGYGTVRFRESFDLLLRSAAKFAKLPGKLIVLSIPDWGVTPFAAGRDRQAIAREIDEFNDVIRTMVAANGARYLDVTSESRQASNVTALLAADGLHPSAMMYSLWVNRLVPLTLDVLDKHTLEKR
jgi:lysophospholipase L1-like esterase